MKFLALLAAVVLLLSTNAFASSVSARHRASIAATGKVQLSSVRLPRLSQLVTTSSVGGFRPLATAVASPTETATPGTTGTPTVSPTPGATVTPSPSPTQSPYPDPVNILTQTFNKYALIKTARYELVTTGAITGQEKLKIDAKGDATCKGPSFTAKVTGSDVLVGTSQSRKVNENFVVIKNKAWIKKSGKNQHWKTTKVASVAAFSFPVDNPLICPSSSSSGSSGGSNSQLKDVVNVGPSTFQNVKVWHIRATEVNVDSTTGQTSDATLDFLVSQGTYLPYVLTVSVADTTQNLTLSQKQILTKFGEKVTIKAPKVGT